MSDTESKALVKIKERGVEAVINYYFQNKTPKEFIKSRPGAGGQVFRYVPVGYVISQLNIAFGFCWEWKVLETNIVKDQIWLRGELTIKDFKTGNSVSRSGVGGSVIKKSRSTSEAISIANDIKSADSDALKVAAAKFGIGADVKFKEMDILEESPDLVEDDNSEATRKILTNKFFAVASDRGFTGEKAKELIKTAFNVPHMENLTIEQLERAIKGLEIKYQVVGADEEPLRIGELRKKSVANENLPIEAVTSELEGDSGVMENPEQVDIEEIDQDLNTQKKAEEIFTAPNEPIKCRQCNGLVPEKRDVESLYFCSIKCQNEYYPELKQKGGFEFSSR